MCIRDRTGTEYTVLIDYAHTPDGVENVLRAVRGFAKGRVIALFGCGGDRDRTKRPKMGKIAADLADFCVVTSDNPRTEEMCIRDSNNRYHLHAPHPTRRRWQHSSV